MLGKLLKNEDSARHMRQALDGGISQLRSGALVLKGRNKFPPRTGLFIEQRLHLVEPGTIVGNQLHDFILRFHRHRPFIVLYIWHRGLSSFS